MSSFVLSTRSETAKNDELAKNTTTSVPIEEGKAILVERHSKSKTQKVSHKLDSLLKRINKRHDFHGSILVAKNGKILYSNYVGYANFKKKEPINETF